MEKLSLTQSQTSFAKEFRHQNLHPDNKLNSLNRVRYSDISDELDIKVLAQILSNES